MRANTVNTNNMKCLAGDYPSIRNLAYDYAYGFVRPMGSHTKNVEIKHHGMRILNIPMQSDPSTMPMSHNSGHLLRRYKAVNRV